MSSAASGSATPPASSTGTEWPPSGRPLGVFPSIEVELSPDGHPTGAVGVLRVPVTPDRVWPLIRDVAHYANRVPMIASSHRVGDRVTMDLKFKVALFAAKFSFVADITQVEGRSVDLRYVSGEPQGLHIRFELHPITDEDGRPATLVRVASRFDLFSLGWLVKFFLKHHPEIQYGVFAGTVTVLLDAIKQGVRGR